MDGDSVPLVAEHAATGSPSASSRLNLALMLAAGCALAATATYLYSAPRRLARVGYEYGPVVFEPYKMSAVDYDGAHPFAGHENAAMPPAHPLRRAPVPPALRRVPVGTGTFGSNAAAESAYAAFRVVPNPTHPCPNPNPSV